MKKNIVIAYTGDDYMYTGLALDTVLEDGKINVIASHLCSSPSWVRHDMGMESDWKHDVYNEAYPDWWELVWYGKIYGDSDIDEIKHILSETNDILAQSDKTSHASVKVEFTS